VEKWHTILQNYLKKKPNFNTLLNFYLPLKYDNKLTRLLVGLTISIANKLNLSLNKDFQEIQTIINRLKTDQELNVLIFKFYDRFPKLLCKEIN
jgi:hypothetical protein